MSRVSPWLLALLFLGLAVGAMVMPLSSENTPYSFLFDRSEAKNDQQRFLNNVVADSGVAKEELEPLLPKLRPLEKQLPVALYLARESGKPLAEIVELRKAERFWLDVMNKTGVKPKVLFEGVEGKFPEPYKAAWIEYRMKLNPELSDEQVRELILLQLAHDVTGKPVEDIVKEGSKGRTPEIVLAKHKPAPSPEATAKAAAATTPAPAPAKGKAKAKARTGAHAR